MVELKLSLHKPWRHKGKWRQSVSHS